MSVRLSSLPLLAVVLLVGSCGRETERLAQEPAPRQTYSVTGLVMSLKPQENRAVIKHQEIPGYMMAMTMPFFVRDTNELAGLIPGEEVIFTMIVTDEDAWIENIEKTGVAENILPAGSGIRIARDVEALEVGDALPDYPFVDEEGHPVRLRQFGGRALVLTFLFTRCPVPNFCPLTARKLAEVQDLLMANKSGPTNWHILAITIDPAFDTPERLKRFGETYGYEPRRWSFLTGELIDITALAEQFGLLFWTEDGTVNHNLRTLIVGADGLIRTNVIGNEWQVDALADALAKAASLDD